MRNRTTRDGPELYLESDSVEMTVIRNGGSDCCEELTDEDFDDILGEDSSQGGSGDGLTDGELDDILDGGDSSGKQPSEEALTDEDMEDILKF